MQRREGWTLHRVRVISLYTYEHKQNTQLINSDILIPVLGFTIHFKT